MKELIYSRLLMPALERYATKPAFFDGAHHSDFSEHGDRVLRLTHAMRTELGMSSTTRYAVMAANSHQFLELYHAAYLGAGVVNPLNLRLAGKELQYILAESEAEVAFVDAFFAEHFLRNIEEVRDGLRIRRVVLIGDADVPHDVSYEDLVASGQSKGPPEVDEDSPVILMYTGGTTGLPKGVLLDQRAEMLNLYHVAMAMGLDDHRIYLHQTPMFHAASMAGVLGIPACGGTSVFVPVFEPEEVMRAIEDQQVNWTTMVPTMIAMVLAAPGFEPDRLASLEDLVYGAAPMPAKLLERLQHLLPRCGLWQGYGMTESSSVLTMLTDRDHRKGGPAMRSVGRALMGVELSIHDREGATLSPGEDGEVWARAGNLMSRYWNRPEETAEALAEGWYHTGDVGHLDSAGYLYLVDRAKDMIVSGGENIYSIEVENAISSHPDVAEVAVIGIPHPLWGEAVHAIVVPKPGTVLCEDDVRAHARRSIAGYKVPKTVELRTAPLPLSGALKPLKTELRRPFWVDGAGLAGLSELETPDRSAVPHLG